MQRKVTGNSLAVKLLLLAITFGRDFSLSELILTSPREMCFFFIQKVGQRAEEKAVVRRSSQGVQASSSSPQHWTVQITESWIFPQVPVSVVADPRVIFRFTVNDMVRVISLSSGHSFRK